MPPNARIFWQIYKAELSYSCQQLLFGFMALAYSERLKKK